jgi:hypothetical protein
MGFAFFLGGTLGMLTMALAIAADESRRLGKESTS